MHEDPENESAFRELVGRFDSGLRRMARLYLEAPAADDVVQDAWIAVNRVSTGSRDALVRRRGCSESGSIPPEGVLQCLSQPLF
jgi:hypothetical protein